MLFAPGAMIPVFCQNNMQVARAGGDKAVLPGEAVCILVTLAEPDNAINTGGLTFSSGPNTTQFGSALFTRVSDTSVRLCHSMDANMPEGVYYIRDFSLTTLQGKRKDYHSPSDFKEPVKFTFENHAKDLPSVTDVKRVPQ